MRFLRMLTNSLLAGAFGSAYLTIIVLQLNPEVPLLSATPWWWFLTLGTLYGVHLGVVLYAVIGCVASDSLAPSSAARAASTSWPGASPSVGTKSRGISSITG